jgi:hypothetical protein
MRIALLITACLLGLSAALAVAAEPDWKKVDAAFGRPAAQIGDVYRFGFPRTDLNVTLDGIILKPAFALGGWIAFRPMGDQAMVMGDLVLTEAEVNPVMAELLADGIEVTAVHNHLLRASPATFYMHVGGHGDPVKMAGSIRTALGLSKTPLDGAPAPDLAPAALDLDTAKLDEVIGLKGRASGGVYQFGVPRADVVTEGGMAVPSSMGSANVINFQPTGEGKAAITGDFIVLATEVNPLISTLRTNRIEVTAIHNHMLGDEPRMFFVHFWANDDAVRLAQGVRAALDKTNVAPKRKS